MQVHDSASQVPLTGSSDTGRVVVARSYRPGLDGLRGLAVAAVFAYHAHGEALPGGWLGVDLFFVLSGFLITRLLLAEHHSWGWISFATFWQARARRLLPAAVLVVCAVLLAAWLWTPVGRRGAVAGDSLATLGYVANWRLVLTDEAYFAAVASPSPLRHAWSLAVEEQYYIIFPLLLAVLLKVAGRRWLPVVLALMALGSALWMAHLHVPGLDPSRVYYGTDTRAHELLVGAVAAAVLAPGSTTSPTVRLWFDRWARRTAPAALVFIGACMVLVSDGADVAFEGGLLAFAVAAAIVIVSAASPNVSPLQRVLSTEPLRLLGVISYGVYLWHWPVIVFASSASLGLPPAGLIAVEAALTLALAIVSFRFVENPIRRHGWSSVVPGRPRLASVAIAGTVLATLGLVVLVPRVGAPLQGQPGDGIAVVLPEYRPGPSVKKVALVGNSVPGSVANGFPSDRFADLRIDPVTHIGCDALDDPKVVNDEVVVAVTGDCREWRRSWPETVATLSPDLTLVFIAHTMLNDIEVDGSRLVAGTAAHDSYLKSQWASMLDKVQGAGSRSTAFVNLACHRLPNLGGSDEITRTNDDTAVRHINSVLTEWSLERKVPVVDQFDLLCADGFADTINGVPLYDDGMHYSSASAAIFWSWIAPQLQTMIDSGQDVR